MIGLFNRRFRGFRVVNLVGLGLLITMVLGVYLAKTFASGERNQIAAVDVEIRQEKARIRLLEAEVAHLEQPRRLQSLARVGLGMQPIAARQEITFADLPRLKPAVAQPAVLKTPAAAPPVAPVPEGQ